MKKIYFHSIYILFCLSLVALSPFTTNAQLAQFAIGDTGYQVATNVKYLPRDKSAIIGGYSYNYSGGVVSNCQAIIMKVYYSSGGFIQWQKTFGIPGRNSIITDIAIAHDGNIIVVGKVNGTGSPYADNTAAIMKFNVLDGSLIWQKCFRDAATTTGGEILWGITELTDGTNRLVAVGAHDYTGGGAGSMICIFQEDGTMVYNEVLDIPSGDELHGVVPTTVGNSVFVSGFYVGTTHKDGMVFSYTPGTTSGTVNWKTGIDYSLYGTLDDNLISKLRFVDSTLIAFGGNLQGYSYTGGYGFSVWTMDTDGSNQHVYGIKNESQNYSNSAVMVAASRNHIFTVQSPGSAYYDPTVLLTGLSTNTVLTEITSLTSGTANTPVKFISPDSSEHNFLDMDYNNSSTLFLAGTTNTSLGFGNSDMYFVVTGTTFSSTNHNCDTQHSTVAIVDASTSLSSYFQTPFSFTPTYITVDTATTHLGITTLCGDTTIDTSILYTGNLQQTNFRIVPNPAQNEINIISPSLIHHLQLIDMTGRVVFNGECNGVSVTVNIDFLPRNIYFVKLNDIEVRKFVKE